MAKNKNRSLKASLMLSMWRFAVRCHKGEGGGGGDLVNEENTNIYASRSLNEYMF